MTALELIRASLEDNRQFTLGLMNGLEGRALTYQPPGPGNHALWILGHLFVSEAQLGKYVGARVTAKLSGAAELFAFRSVPQPDAAKYPTKQQLLDYGQAVRKSLLAALGRTKAADLDRKPLSREAPEFIRSRGHGWQVLIMHESMHCGQLVAIRRALSLPPIIG